MLVTQRYAYTGCFTSRWARTPTDVPITAEGVQICRDKCTLSGFDYFGFECPHENGAEVHCECTNSINPSEKIEDQMCQQFNFNSGSHCTGPFVVNTDFGTYYMGAGGINSGYATSPVPSQGKFISFF